MKVERYNNDCSIGHPNQPLALLLGYSIGATCILCLNCTINTAVQQLESQRAAKLALHPLFWQFFRHNWASFLKSVKKHNGAFVA